MTRDAIPALDAPLDSLPGIGPRHSKLLEKIATGPRVLDLLFTVPERIIDRGTPITLAEAATRELGSVITTKIRVISRRDPARPGQPTVLHTTDGTGTLDLVFFQKRSIPKCTPGTELLTSGRVSVFNNQLTLTPPDHLVTPEEHWRIPTLEPVWPLTAGLFQGTVAKAMRAALALLSDIPEWHDPTLVARRRWPSFTEALHTLQAPNKTPDADPILWHATLERARTRLAADEILADQLCIALARHQAKARPGQSRPGTGILQKQLQEKFGHPPTEAQRNAIADITQDMANPTPMMRLLQGDVGAGKTFVAMHAMLQAVESGAQAALMAPTEILARQHYETISHLCPAPCIYLSGNIQGSARKQVLSAIASGEAKLIIGTHALFQENVLFANLGLAVIDEQHRFGVEQRMALSNKGHATDILVMTATPIPRTLQLMEWGEMSVSKLDSKPKGRQPIRSTLHRMSALGDIINAVKRALAANAQIFWVCPLIENSETASAAAAEERWAMLCDIFGPDTIGLAHGRQDITVRQTALDAFRTGKTRLLVATTVIEVGVDIPNASIMVIEHAERFGLAQLHQLRGRVGRGAKQSFCLLLHDDELSSNAQQRLSLMRDTTDGFVIADEDYRLRGGGDLAGHRQSGLPGLRLAHGRRIAPLAHAMRQDSEREVTRNPNLEKGRGPALQTLLRFFKRDKPERLLISG
ncbi:ATP-dependent DNA helicase RecG [Neokomagataea thailandica]|uniref:DNA helicase RecG n=1 Tax=Neokomagataea tanensis NBRC 106556 TaxID=1223519 RepID=A0ABQ0QKK3_9PROT|nr:MULTISPECIES: ATP-dependent DNA helicase RecG [Neokomagataea]GBR47989.1 DNA helicase RecG [Neokomagataea tanensis NBRC 106556]